MTESLEIFMTAFHDVVGRGNDRSQAERNKIEMDAVISYVEKKSVGFLQQPRLTTSRNCDREISLPFSDCCLDFLPHKFASETCL